MIVLLLACGTSGTPADSAADSADACADAPALTWESFGQGFLTQQCQTCHASTAPDRHGAPADVHFDTVDDAWHFSAAILGTAAGDTPTMPPEGGPSADDRQRLEWWLRCGVEGT